MVSVREVPALGQPRKLKLPKTGERTLSNGLSVIAVRRPSVPLLEVRLRLPFAKAHLARSSVLSRTLFSGTETMSTVDLAAELQKIGGGLSAGTDPDRLMISGNSLAPGMARLFELLTEVLTGATYPAGEVSTERDRLADAIRVANTQPSHLARTALHRRVYGRHPYAVQTPEPDQVLAVSAAQLRAMHAERLHPAGATLVLVGDVPVEKALDTAEQALSAWNGGGKSAELPPVPEFEPGPITLADRPGSVQSALRMAFRTVGRTDPDNAAVQLANLILGGYFSSRLVENIREDKGYTYSPHSGVEHSAAGSAVVISADVATDVTTPALLEMWYELGRLASLPPSAEELEQARQYALGTLQLGVATQAGLASLAAVLAGHGLRLEWLAEHVARLAAATRDDVAAAAQRYFAPSRAVTVILGDADAVEPRLGVLDEVTRA